MPDGVGERHVLEALDGRITIIEVIECEPEQRALMRLISPAPKREMRFSYELQPVDDGCLYSMGFEMDLLRGQHIRQQFKDEWRANIQAMFGRIRQVLADAERDRTAVGRHEPPTVSDDETPPEAATPDP